MESNSSSRNKTRGAAKLSFHITDKAFHHAKSQAWRWAPAGRAVKYDHELISSCGQSARTQRARLGPLRPGSAIPHRTRPDARIAGSATSHPRGGHLECL